MQHPARAEVRVIDLLPQLATIEAFAPYGRLIEKAADGAPFAGEAMPLVLDRGMPRFYVMTLKRREPAFDRITRHRAVTQCLASAGGAPWLIAVAPPDAPDDPQAQPDLARLTAFRIAGDQAIMLARGTWHAGPFFEGGEASFFNLELADTNENDHQDCLLDREFGVTYCLA